MRNGPTLLVMDSVYVHAAAHPMVKCNELVPVPDPLVALKPTVKVPAACGVPVIWPAPSTDKPAGKPEAPQLRIGGFVAEMK